MKHEIETKTPGTVLLITGPAASGKTTLAAVVAELPGWVRISEDDYWARHKWHGLRTEEQETTVQKEVMQDLRKLVDQGQNVALEFILYKTPPNPLTKYIASLRKTNTTLNVVVLKPDLSTIVAQMHQRGRPGDLNDLENRNSYAVSQIACLEDGSIDPSWVIDTPGLTPIEVFDLVIARVENKK